MINTDKVQFKRGNSNSWISKDITLDEGEPGWERDTNRLKIGDGKTKWSMLPYFGEGGGQGGTESFSHHQVSPSSSWILVHNLGVYREPVVFLDDEPSRPVYPDYEFTDSNNLNIIFDQPVTGWAHI